MSNAGVHDNRSPIDTSALDELRQYQDDGGPDILGELIDIFIDDTPKRLTAVKEAVEAGDFPNAELNAHAMKSSCAQLGAMRLSEMCMQLETMGREGNMSAAMPVVLEAEHEWEAVREALLAEKG